MQEDRSAWAVRWAAHLLRFLSGGGLLVLMLLTCADVIGRYFFNNPIQGATELTQMIMGFVVFSALPVVTASGTHVAVDLLDPLFKGMAQRIRDVAIDLISAVVLGVIAWRVWILAERVMRYGDTTPYLEIPRYPLVYVIALMVAIAALAALVKAISDIHEHVTPPATGVG